MADELHGRRVAVITAPRGTEQPEFEEPRKVEEQAGAPEVLMFVSPSAQDTITQGGKSR
jgi:hypothetical protein